MAVGTRSIDPGRLALREVTAGAACLVSVTAGLQLVAGYLPNPITRAFAGAFALSLVTSAVGLEAEPWGLSARARVARALFLGLAVALVTLAAALALGARLGAGELGLGTFLGVAECLAAAYRDEVWLRGLPLHFAKRAGISSRIVVPYLVATGVAAVLLDPAAKPAGLALTGASGLAFALLWLRSGDPWAPVAAHAAWRLASDVVFAGDAFELEPAKLPTGVGASGILAWVTVAAMVGVALSSGRVSWRSKSSVAPPKDEAEDSAPAVSASEHDAEPTSGEDRPS